jgi:uncharacterized protein (DUF2336 family)
MDLSHMFLLYANRVDRHKRAELTSVLARAYAGQTEPHPDQDNILLALTAMAADPAIEVRSALSGVVAGSSQFPRSLHLILAKDVAQVSAPVFARSTCLPDTELLAGLASNNPLVQCAIAGRTDLSPVVVDTLAQSACNAAVLKLLDNLGSRLTLEASERVWQRFENPTHADHKQVTAQLLRRHDVSAFVKLKIDFLGDVAGEPPQPDVKQLERRLDRIVLRTAQAEGHELPAIARFLHERRWLNTFVIIRAALAGQFAFTAALLAEACAMKPGRALRLCRMGGFTLRGLCRYAGLSKHSGQLLARIMEETKSLQDGQPLDYEAVTRLIRMMDKKGIPVEDALYGMMLQREARLLIEHAQKRRYDLTLKSMAAPEMPEPSGLQDDVVEPQSAYAAYHAIGADKAAKTFSWPFKPDSNRFFGALESVSVPSKARSA